MFRLLFLGAALLVVVEGTLIKPPPCKPIVCNIYEKQLVWVLEDCICRCIQNKCLMDQENASRLRSKKTPLVPVSEQLCKHFIQKCKKNYGEVTADFPNPPACGCKNKPGTITKRTFHSVCELKSYSAKNNEAYTKYVYTHKKKAPKKCKFLRL